MATKLEFDMQLSDHLSAAETSTLKAGQTIQLQASQNGGLVEVMWQDINLGTAPAQHSASLIR
jgi:hypothetical protein